MSPRTTSAFLLVAVLAAPAVGAPRPDPVEDFLTEHRLETMLETHLRRRLDRAGPAERASIIDRLGRLYLERLTTEPDPAARDDLLERARALLADAGPADAIDLRLGLAIARFHPAEDVAERAVMRLAAPDEAESAAGTLAEIAREIDAMGMQLEREVLAEQRVARANPDEPAAALADARRQLSLAKYYAGWAYLHLSRLRDEPADAQRAIEQFAWVLDLPNELPSLDRLPPSLLRYDHVARAAIGVALAKSRLGRDTDAAAWLDAVDAAEPDEPIAAQVFARRLTVLPAAGQWSVLAKRVQAWRDAHPGPLDEPLARLLAVEALDAARADGTPAGARAEAQRLAALALGDLVDRDALDQVLDLTRRFGELPLRGDAFVPRYVRGAALFDRARLAHRAAGDAAAPTADPDAAELYHAAQADLRAAAQAPDAPDHPKHRLAAAIMAARCDYFTDRLAPAADAFLAAERLATTDAGAEDALWMAVVCLDALAAREPDARPRARELATRFLAEHPASPRAPLLLLRSLDADLVPRDRAIEILRAVPESDPISDTARRHLARLLYAAVREAAPAERPAAAAEFLALARELLDEALATTRPEDLDPAAEHEVLLRARQALDIALLLDPPLIGQAERALAIAERVPLASDPEIAAELRLRRVQLALARRQPSEADRAYDGFAPDDPLAPVALDLLVDDARERWAERERTAASARRLIAHATRAQRDESRRPDLDEAIAEAAAWLWRTEGETPMRDLAITLDERAFRGGLSTAAGLRRLAEFAEAASRAELARDAWLAMMASTDPGTPAWFEARLRSLSLLAELDPPAARDALDQTRVLYPSLGGPGCAPQFERLDALLPPPEAPEP